MRIEKVALGPSIVPFEFRPSKVSEEEGLP